jgi:hypothetical protein
LKLAEALFLFRLDGGVLRCALDLHFDVSSGSNAFDSRFSLDLNIANLHGRSKAGIKDVHVMSAQEYRQKCILEPHRHFGGYLYGHTRYSSQRAIRDAAHARFSRLRLAGAGVPPARIDMEMMGIFDRVLFGGTHSRSPAPLKLIR